MADLNITKTTTLDRGITNYSVTPQALEYAENGEVFVDFPNAAKYFGYYKKYGQLKKAIDTLCLYVVGKGYDTDNWTQDILEFWTGQGEDTVHSLFWNLMATSLIQGDAFAEIIREKDYTGFERIINLKPISPERMRVVYGSNGLIKRYEQIRNGKPVQKFNKNDIFHIVNDRIADEQRGNSVIECCEWVINAIEEARRDYRVLLHRNIVPVRIIEVDTDDIVQRNAFMAEYKDAIQKGEVLVIPKGTVEFKSEQITIQDPINWIQSLENYFYLAVGIPRIIASPDALSEGASKVGYMIFEPIYTYRQTLLEADIWQQLNLKLTFNRPPSLMDSAKQNENKNTSQTSIQPKEVSATMERE
jgi:hypothetical protein